MREPSRLLGLVLLVMLASSDGAVTAQDRPDEGWTAPDPQPGEPLCGRCKTRGRLEFEVDEKWLIERVDAEQGWRVLYCSEAIHSENHALDWEVCTRCKTPSLKALAERDHAEAVGAMDAWLEERMKVDRAVGSKKPLMHLETTHFVLAWNIPKITTADKKTYRMHAAMHLYASRLEDLYARFQDLFEVDDSNNMVNKHHLYVFRDERSFHEATPRYTGLTSRDSSARRMGGVDTESSLTAWWNKGRHPKEADLFRMLAHHTIHQVTSVYYDTRWFPPGEMGLHPPWLADKYGWLDVGLAHFFELELDGLATTQCMREQDNSIRWRGPDWRKNIYKAVAGGRVPSFSDIIVKPAYSLSAMEHQFAWSWVDFLIDRDAAAMGKALTLAKQERPTRDLLKEGWGLSVLGFEQVWSEWVQENYAPQRR